MRELIIKTVGCPQTIKNLLQGWDIWRRQQKCAQPMKNIFKEAAGVLACTLFDTDVSLKVHLPPPSTVSGRQTLTDG